MRKSKIAFLITAGLTIGCVVMGILIPKDNEGLPEVASTENVIPAPALSIPESSLNLGIVWATPTFRWQIPITNVSRTNVVVSEFATSCSCTVVNADGEQGSLTIPPGETRMIDLSIDLRQANHGDFDVQPFAVNLMAELQNSLSINWSLKGQVRSAFHISESLLIEGIAKSNKGVSLRTKLQACPELIQLIVKSSASDVTAALSPGKSAGEYWLEICADGRQDPCKFTRTLFFEASDLEGNSIAMEWPVTIVYDSDLSLKPQIPHLGVTEIKKFVEAEFSVVRRSGKPTGVVTAELVCSDNLVGECTVVGSLIRLRVSPQVPGNQGFQLILSEIGATERNDGVFPFTVYGLSKKP